MQQNFTENHLVYKIKDSDLYAAIGDAYLRDIRQYAAEYQCLGDVPEDRMVKGLLFKMNKHLCELKGNGEEINLPVNRLEFDTGNLRFHA